MGKKSKKYKTKNISVIMETPPETPSQTTVVTPQPDVDTIQPTIDTVQQTDDTIETLETTEETTDETTEETIDTTNQNFTMTYQGFGTTHDNFWTTNQTSWMSNVSFAINACEKCGSAFTPEVTRHYCRTCLKSICDKCCCPEETSFNNPLSSTRTCYDCSPNKPLSPSTLTISSLPPLSIDHLFGPSPTTVQNSFSVSETASTPPMSPYKTTIMQSPQPIMSSISETASTPPMSPYKTTTLQSTQPLMTSIIETASTPPMSPYKTTTLQSTQPIMYGISESGVTPPLSPYKTTIIQVKPFESGLEIKVNGVVKEDIKTSVVVSNTQITPQPMKVEKVAEVKSVETEQDDVTTRSASSTSDEKTEIQNKSLDTSGTSTSLLEFQDNRSIDLTETASSQAETEHALQLLDLLDSRSDIKSVTTDDNYIAVRPEFTPYGRKIDTESQSETQSIKSGDFTVGSRAPMYSKSLASKKPPGRAVKCPKIIVAGPPGSGKSAQSEVLRQELNVVHLSVGDVIRNVLSSTSEEELIKQNYMDHNGLTDEFITRCIADRIMKPDCQVKGWLLDDFPRNRYQAAALSYMNIKPDVFIYLNVTEDVLTERVTGRRLDPVTGNVYHLKHNPPRTKAIESRLIQRSDDTPESFKKRYDEFSKNIDSIQYWYSDKVLHIDGAAAPFSVSHQILTALDGDYYTIATEYRQGEDVIPTPVSAAIFPNMDELYIPETAQKAPPTKLHIEPIGVDISPAMISTLSQSPMPNSATSANSNFVSTPGTTDTNVTGVDLHKSGLFSYSPFSPDGKTPTTPLSATSVGSATTIPNTLPPLHSPLPITSQSAKFVDPVSTTTFNLPSTAEAIKNRSASITETLKNRASNVDNPLRGRSGSVERLSRYRAGSVEGKDAATASTIGSTTTATPVSAYNRASSTQRFRSGSVETSNTAATTSTATTSPRYRSGSVAGLNSVTSARFRSGSVDLRGRTNSVEGVNRMYRSGSVEARYRTGSIDGRFRSGSVSTRTFENLTPVIPEIKKPPTFFAKYSVIIFVILRVIFLGLLTQFLFDWSHPSPLPDPSHMYEISSKYKHKNSVSGSLRVIHHRSQYPSSSGSSGGGGGGGNINYNRGGGSSSGGNNGYYQGQYNSRNSGNNYNNYQYQNTGGGQYRGNSNGGSGGGGNTGDNYNSGSGYDSNGYSNNPYASPSLHDDIDMISRRYQDISLYTCNSPTCAHMSSLKPTIAKRAQVQVVNTHRKVVRSLKTIEACIKHNMDY